MHQLEQLIQSIEMDKRHTYPPVESWQPSHVGEIDIYIDSQGKWWHEGTPFEREALVNLFASILRFENDAYYLVTPVEKLKITVADVAFMADSLICTDVDEKVYQLVTQCNDIIALDENADWELRDYQDTQIPYVRVRHDLWARIDRHVFYQMADIAIKQAEVIRRQGKVESVKGEVNSSGELNFISSASNFCLGSFSE